MYIFSQLTNTPTAAYELSYKEWIWVLLKDHVKVDLAVVSVQKAAGLSAIGYVGSVVNKFLPEPKVCECRRTISLFLMHNLPS